MNQLRLSELWELVPGGSRKDERGEYNQRARDRIRRFLARLQDERGVQILHRVGWRWYYDPSALALCLPDIATDPYSEEIQGLKARIHQLESRLARLERQST
ncbi:hypothetical protein [Polyangium spumosum]|uniref:Uncharacterized protein n=1 Tax=Polyangium spumosum TaxID=889282 RepID=A0A6N7Q6B0_9BACT|nr:hypothetical protein [Polyangium spumosum]MRG98225.1 hypothetical protein [Polyangium spumosum]